MQRQPPRHRLADELTEHLEQRMFAAYLHVSIRRDDHDGHVAELSGEKLQQEQRRRIGSVEIIDDEEKWLAPSGVAQESRNAVEQAEPRLIGVDRLGSERSATSPPTSGTTCTMSAAPEPMTDATSARAESCTYERITWIHGQYGGAPPLSSHRPQSTCACNARLADSGSPPKDTRRPCPARLPLSREPKKQLVRESDLVRRRTMSLADRGAT
jgi:hypothetical protein